MLREGDTAAGFVVKSVEEIPEYHAMGVYCIHKATGLEVFHVHNDDEENFFSFNFKTVPKNAKGTAHIVEHAVLAGSQRYPVKDPFVEILKGSAQTFLNAMTYPDRTLYPGASPIKKDYYNLLHLYADAVFFPLLRKETFHQEGIRLVLDHDRSLQYQGIVFNEMRGAYSTHDSIVAEESIRQLFPDTPMQYDSGGDPRSIAELTYEEFKGFHAENYHPSNCRIFLYGSIPTEEQLEFLQNQFLADFSKVQVSAEVPEPKRWKKPKTVHATSPANPGEPGSGKSTITVNWLTRQSYDPVMLIAYEVLTELLLGNPGAPVYRAIIDSGIGEDVAPLSGMEGELRDMVFTIGVRGAKQEDKQSFEGLIRRTLQKLVRNGIPEQQVLSAVRKVEFQQKEMKGGIPRGLRCLVRTLRGWMYDVHPSVSLRFLPAMQQVKTAWEQDPNFFTQIIKEDLLDNPHRLTVVVSPSADHEKQFELPLKRRLEGLQSSLSREDMQLVEHEQQKLKEFHERSDPPEELEKVPRLRVEDLPTSIQQIDTEVDAAGNVPLLMHRYHTNDICYVDFLFSTEGLTEEEALLLPLLSRLIYTTSMPGMSYGDVSSRLAECTGGFYSLLDISSPFAPQGAHPKQHIIFRAKFLARDMERAVMFIKDLLKKSSLHNTRRLKDIISEGKNDFSVSLLPSGNSFAALRAGSRLRPVLYREDQWKGIGQMLFLHRIDTSDPAAVREIGRKLSRLRKKLLTKQRCLFNCTCPEELMQPLKQQLQIFSDELPEVKIPQAEELPIAEFRKYEGIIAPSQVAFCSYSMPSSPPGSVEQLRQGILSYVLSTHYLYEQVRLQGGAYGVGASLNLFEGLITFVSYRDPSIHSTLQAFEASLHQTASDGISPDLLERALISVVSKDVRPLSPAEKGYLGLRRWMLGIDDETRRKRRELTLETTPEDIQCEARHLAEAFSSGVSAVLAGSALLQKEAKEIPELEENPTTLPS